LRQSVPATELKLEADEIATCDDVWFNLPRLRDPAIAMR
jgi:hypothetical protein